MLALLATMIAVPPTTAVAAEPAAPARSDLSVLTRSAVPARKRVDGTWKELDATLVRNADGSVSPALAQDQLRLSGGAGAPMAVMGTGGLTATIDTTVPLPAPVLSGDTAVYREILPGVDLRVTASITGGFSEVFVVKNADAAANPALAKLSLRTATTGVNLVSDATGNITGKDRTGRTVLTAPAPQMWDSALAPGKTFRAPDGVEVNSKTRMPTRSSIEGPGAGARSARVAAAVRAGSIELVPDAKLLTDAATFPVYIDPTFHWDSVGAKNNGWATLPRQFPGTNYWKDTPDPLGRMQVGNSGEISSRTFINFPMPNSTLAGAKIDTATFKITQTQAWSCTPSRVNLYAPATTLSSSNATWNYWDGRSLGSIVDYKTVAHGYNDNCRPEGVPFDVKSTIAANVSSGKKTQTFVLSAGNESDTNAWKEFLETSPTLSITFNHKPNKPTGMTTSPKTACAATVPTVVGDGMVTLYAPVSDRNASVLGVNFTLWKSSTPGTLLESTNPDLLTYKSGSTAVFRINTATLRAAAGTAVTKFSWHVRVTDFDMSSDWSATCSFQFDASRTGAPTIIPPAEDAASIGSSVTIPVTPAETGTVPTSYLYQLNGGPYGTTAAVAGATEITIIPTRFTNTLTVTGLSPGGNIGDTAAVTFNATPAATAVDNDFNGDNIADLLTVGGANNLAAGVWLAPGKGDGVLAPAATNIGAQGNGLFLTNKPTDFNGAQVITGRFAGYGLQDLLAYYPNGTSPGVAVVLRGNGDGSTIQAQLDGNYDGIQAGTLTDNNGFDPRQLANAGYPGGAAYPDLIGISGDAQGYYLNYYPNMGMVGGYGVSATLPAQMTPTGETNWDTWTITTAQTTTGTAMFLWQRTTGKLYLWNNLTYDGDQSALNYTQHLLSPNWNAGQSVTPQAADINGDDIADLWAVGANGNTTPWLVSGLTPDAGTITAGPAGRVLTGTHMWLLNDAAEGPVTDASVAKDSIGNLPATGAGKAQWNSGDLFSPSLELDSGPDSALRTTGPAVNTNADFTVAAWVKISKAGGTVMSQDGPKGAAFRVWADSSDSSWRFALPSNNSATQAWTVAAARAGSVKTDVWTHLSASFKKSTGVMDLHVNGIDVASAVHLTPWSSTGPFRIGVQLNPTGTIGGFLKGQIAEVSTFDQVVLYDKGNPAIRDFSGDRRSDVFGVHSDTKLYLYRGNGAGRFQAGGGIIGTGWDDFTAVVSPGDFTGDGFSDVIARKADGSLKLYRGNGASGWLNGKAPDSIGTGWNQFNLIFSPGDFTGDGKSDLLARKPDGSLWLYRGNGTGGWLNGTAPDPVGNGWHHLTAVLSPGDFNGDGKADAIGRLSDGTLLLYRGTGTGAWTGDGIPIGSGWNQFSAIFSPGDFTGDGKPDLFARKTDGTLLLYRGNGTGSWINGNAPDNVGNGWHWFTKLF